MDYRILNKDFEDITDIDVFKSMIWTSRFNECGDFELCTVVDEKYIKDDSPYRIFIGYYVFSPLFYNKETNRASLMIIESMEIMTNGENGNILKYTGRDLKSILDRRIIWGPTSFDPNTRVNTIIFTLIDDCIINPKNFTRTYQDSHSGTVTVTINGGKRAISNFIREDETTSNPPVIDEDLQYNCDSLYEVVVNLCDHYKMGWDILYDFSLKKFVFILKSRVDKTTRQYEHEHVIFSSQLENLKNCNYIESSASEKNAALIYGEGDEYNVMYNIIGDEFTGLDRKEMAVDASNLVQNETSSGGDYKGNAEYLNALKNRGTEDLSNNKYTKIFEGDVVDTGFYKYPDDYDIGDICELSNEYGIESYVLIDEIMLSVSENDYNIVPSFKSIEEDTT